MRSRMCACVSRVTCACACVCDVLLCVMVGAVKGLKDTRNMNIFITTSSITIQSVQMYKMHTCSHKM